MTGSELKADLRVILAAEERAEIDWTLVEKLCLATLHRLNTEVAPDYPHDVVYHFLDDADVRQKDDRYARVQRQRLAAWLNASA